MPVMMESGCPLMAGYFPVFIDPFSPATLLISGVRRIFNHRECVINLSGWFLSASLP